ncbi:hypothetical protein [Mucilaginibacter agri]|uniref:Uncharacterized protein n=1 Tax=Mucilaginibacter agri TaxID=2695265 RepID=A0A965ZDY5_9SPHI|nr:hypothetical protein [Mucilaginibacter agri]NCD68011.1 hypothetical protein [Mucilaginibacter agri]
MIAKQQILIQKLATLKSKIQQSESIDKIIEYVEEAVEHALPVEPMVVTSKFKAQRKKATKIQLLQMELQAVKNMKQPDLEYIRFQFSSSMILLISVFSNEAN